MTFFSFRRCLLVLSGIAISVLAAPLSTAEVMFKGRSVHPTRIFAKVAPNRLQAAQAATLQAQGLAVQGGFALVPGLLVLDVDATTQAAAARSGKIDPREQAKALAARIDALKKTGAYTYVEPDYIVRASALPTDSAFADGTLWGLRNTGQSSGVAGVDIDAVRAWDLTTGSPSVIVAIIDSGIRYTHQDLATQMWRNPGEIAGNGVDDDADGYVDNVFGINAITRSGDPMDDNDHGTHVAGTIGAAANDGRPHVGVCWQVQLMGCKFLDAEGSGATSDAIRCIEFAVANGARILNNSWGGGGYSQALFDAIAAARDAGVLFLAAAGNESADNDTTASYPANYQLDNVLSVAAIDRLGQLASFSNFGDKTVHLAAPGVSIYSSISTGAAAYDSFNGTSMATPHVSGVAALVLARFPELSLAELRERLVGTTVPTASLLGKTITGGRVNAYQALDATPDGVLEAVVSSSTGSILIGGTTATLYTRVTDLAAVSNATVTGSAPGFSALIFRNDGVAPDQTGGDAVYSAAFPVPTTGAGVTLTVQASAPGKTGVTVMAGFTFVQPPANDAFAQRLTLSGAATTTAGSNLGASKESGEPNHVDDVGGKSVWWTWTAPTAGTVTITTAGSNFDTTLGVYTGSTLGTLTLVGGNDDTGDTATSLVSFAATAGTTYQIAVDGFQAASGAISLAVNLVSTVVAANDTFANRVTLAGVNATGSASSVGASKQSGEPNHGTNAGGASLWWTWTAPASGNVTIDTNGSSFDTLLGAYTGNAVGSLVTVAGDDDSGAGDASLMTFAATAGTVYQLAVDGYNGASGSVVINLSFAATNTAPANDAFASRIPLSGMAVSSVGSNLGATKEIGEPAHAANGGGRSVWWTWTAPSTGVATITTAGSAFDTLLAVYTGTNVGALTLVAENDQDAQGGTTSRVSFAAVAGVSYQLAVDGANFGFGAATGTISLQVVLSSSAAPANDVFANRIALEGVSVATTGSTVNATVEPDEPIHPDNEGGASIWWRWTAPSDGLVTITTAGSSFDTLLAVYTGNSPASLVSVAADDDSGPGTTSQVVFTGIEGTVYQIAVDGFDAESGSVALSVTLLANATPPANDLFVNRTTLSGATVSLTATNIAATKEAGEPNHAGSVGGGSVWWTWTAPANGTVSVNTNGSDIDTVLGIYTGSAVRALTVIAADDDAGAGTASLVGFNVSAGTSYQIAVDGYSEARGNLTLALDFIATGPTAPDAPVANPASAVSAGGFTASWTAVSGASGYRLDIATDAAFGSYVTGYQNLDVGNVTAFPATALNPATGYFYRVRAYNAGGPSVSSNVVTVLTAANFISWQQAHFTLDELADPARSGPNAIYGQDGWPNLLKYALGLNPKENVTVGGPVVGSTDTEWTYTYARMAEIVDATFTVEASTNLVTWSTTGVTHELIGADGPLQFWRARVAIGTAPALYFRLKVTR